MRRGATEARVEGRFEDDDGSEQVLARVLPADGRSRAYVDGRLATVGELASDGCAPRRAARPARPAAAASRPRRNGPRSTGSPGPRAVGRARGAPGGARRGPPTSTRELAALGGDARARARELDLLRFQVEEIDAAGLEDPGRRSRSRPRRRCSPTRRRTGRRCGVAYRAVEGLVLEGLGEAIGALDDRAPFRELVERLRVGQAEIGEVERELRLVAEGIPDDPGRLDEVRGRRRALRELQRKYGETLAEVLAFADDDPAADRGARGLRGAGRGARGSGARWRRTRAADAARGLTEARRAAAGPLAAAVVGHLRELAMPHARLEVAVEAGGAHR